MHRPLVPRMGFFRSARLWSLRTKVVRRLNSSALLVGQAPQDRGADARPAMDERPGMVEIDLAMWDASSGWMRSSMSGRCGVSCACCGACRDSDGAGYTRVYLACHPVGMRLGFDGLAARVARVLDGDPFSGHLFLFRGKRADYLKVLYYGGTGLCLFAERLESGRFVWPPIVDGKMWF